MKRLHLAGLEVTAVPSAVATYAAVSCLAGYIERKRRRLPTGTAMAVGLMMAGLHGTSVLFHHFGHAAFARYTGHPMTGIRFWGGLATSVYPSNEPPLPATVHLTRAAGGPLTSLLLAIIVAAIRSRRNVSSEVLSDLVLFVVFDNIFVLAVGSLAPLSFTDGGTLLALSRCER
jgi:hypothetical protein